MAERILIIDDTPVIREFLIEVLEDAGFEVDSAENGKKGYEMASRNDYRLIFCDVHMPIMNGLQAVMEIKKIKPEIPIIMTDSMPGKTAEQAAQAGAIGCLAKPFDLNELKSMIGIVLKKDRVSSLK
jgi:two-component system response regulator (stage 0 sporulation protein F)